MAGFVKNTDNFQEETVVRIGPKTYAIEGCSGNKAEMYHTDCMDVGINLSYNDDGSWKKGFVVLALEFGDAGLYNALTAGMAEKLANQLNAAAAELRKHQDKPKPKGFLGNMRKI